MYYMPAMRPNNNKSVFNVRSKADISQLTYCTEPTTKKWKLEKKLKSKKTDTLKSIGKQSGESGESVPKKKRKATMGRIWRKGRF